ncbi:dual specificity protein phosphatase family protein [Lacticaseibacillus parakribbianus]|uniref:dual specificity protein phosphatase family protein n=1 Tax=Lacticaseibacillus parakribbianus TaxID=2970927 RepID=UPI0021CB6776|nr:dual specificity protein phosphatase family protein [Lacticaseibacillus parakribbianus]
MTTTVYSLDLASYKLFQPHRQQTDVLILHGSFDAVADSAEIAADRQYARVRRINADDVVASTPGKPASVLTVDAARDIDAFIRQAIADGHDLVVHCHAGQSRTGAVLELAFFQYGLPCVHVRRWQSGRKIQEGLVPVTRENFYTFYVPNRLWHGLFQTLYPGDSEQK